MDGKFTNLQFFRCPGSSVPSQVPRLTSRSRNLTRLYLPLVVVVTTLTTLTTLITLVFLLSLNLLSYGNSFSVRNFAFFPSVLGKHPYSCLTRPLIQHEFLHALGLLHDQVKESMCPHMSLTSNTITRWSTGGTEFQGAVEIARKT